MSSTRRTTVVTAAACAMIGAMLLPATPAMAAPGDVTVTYFEDRTSDGVFDTAVASPAGEVDQKRTFGYVYLHDSAGDWWATTADADGDFSFAGIPSGETNVYVGTPDPYVSTAIFTTDRTGVPEKLPQRNDVSFTDGTYVAPDGSTAPIILNEGQLLGHATLTVGAAEAAVSIGMSSLGANADVVLADSGEPVEGAVEVTFFNNAESYPGSEWSAGEFSPLDGENTAHFSATSIGISIEPSAGYAIADVTAATSSGAPLDLTREGDRYSVGTAQIGRYFENVDFAVTLAEVPTADVTITRFDDRYLDGVFDPSLTTGTGEADEKRDSGYVYINDVNGGWWATTANDDGDYALTGIPAGPATVYLDTPNAYVSSVFWDATGLVSYEDIERGSHAEISFDDGTYIAPDGSPLPIVRPTPQLAGAVDVELTEGAQSFEIGMASLTQGAYVVDEAGEPVADTVEVTFGSNDETFVTAAGAGDDPYMYAAEPDGTSQAFFPASTLSLRADATTGYEIVSVEAASSISGEAFEITGSGAAWSMTPEQIDTYFDGVEWTVVVAEADEPAPGPGPGPQPSPEPSPGAPGTPDSPDAADGEDRKLADTGADLTSAFVASAAALVLLALGAAVLIARRRLG